MTAPYFRLYTADDSHALILAHQGETCSAGCNDGICIRLAFDPVHKLFRHTSCIIESARTPLRARWALSINHQPQSRSERVLPSPENIRERLGRSPGEDWRARQRGASKRAGTPFSQHESKWFLHSIPSTLRYDTLETRRISKHLKEEVTKAVSAGTQSIAGIADQYGVSVTQVMRWKIRQDCAQEEIDAQSQGKEKR